MVSASARVRQSGGAKPRMSPCGSARPIGAVITRVRGMTLSQPMAMPHLRTHLAMLAAAVGNGSLTVAGGYYDLATGEVRRDRTVRRLRPGVQRDTARLRYIDLDAAAVGVRAGADAHACPERPDALIKICGEPFPDLAPDGDRRSVVADGCTGEGISAFARMDPFHLALCADRAGVAAACAGLEDAADPQDGAEGHRGGPRGARRCHRVDRRPREAAHTDIGVL